MKGPPQLHPDTSVSLTVLKECDNEIHEFRTNGVLEEGSSGDERSGRELPPEHLENSRRTATQPSEATPFASNELHECDIGNEEAFSNEGGNVPSIAPSSHSELLKVGDEKKAERGDELGRRSFNEDVSPGDLKNPKSISFTKGIEQQPKRQNTIANWNQAGAMRPHSNYLQQKKKSSVMKGPRRLSGMRNVLNHISSRRRSISSGRRVSGPKTMKGDTLLDVWRRSVRRIQAIKATRMWLRGDRGWSLPDVLESQRGVDKLREFMTSERSEESLLFYLECEAFKTCTVEERKTESKRIVETYILDTGPFQVNLDHYTCVALKANVIRGVTDPTIFDRAQNIIYLLMANDAFPRFRKSRMFLELNNWELQGIDPPPYNKNGDGARSSQIGSIRIDTTKPGVVRASHTKPKGLLDFCLRVVRESSSAVLLSLRRFPRKATVSDRYGEKEEETRTADGRRNNGKQGVIVVKSAPQPS